MDAEMTDAAASVGAGVGAGLPPTSAAVHRVRFVDWAPAGVTALDFAPAEDILGSAGASGSSNTARGIMAVGREDGSIALCTWVEDARPASVSAQAGGDAGASSSKSASGAAKGWVVHTVLVSPQQSSIDNLCFVRSPLAAGSGGAAGAGDAGQGGSALDAAYAAAAAAGGLRRKEAPPTVLRLFSTSGGSLVTEHFLPPDLALPASAASGSARPSSGAGGMYGPALRAAAARARARAGTARALSSDAGTIWALAPSALGRLLALGCEGGEVRVLDVGDSERFAHLDSASELFARSARSSAQGAAAGQAAPEKVGAVGRMEKTKGRVMSLAWGPPRLVSGSAAARRAAANTNGKGKARANAQDDESDSESSSGSATSSDDSSESDSSDSDDDEEQVWDESFLVGGTSSSSAVVWDVSTGRLLSRLSVFKNRSESTVVWAAAVLADGTIVLGDSNGAVTFYDARTRLPLPTATFRVHGDKADVLALCVGPDGRRVYSASVDQKVAEYALVGAGAGAGTGGSKGKQPKWVHTGTRRLHAHDIRALAIEPKFDMAAAAMQRAAAQAGQQQQRQALAPRLPILASGGTDFHVVLTPAAGADLAAYAGAAALGADGGKAASRRGKRALGAATMELVNPVSDSPLVTFADTTQRRVAYVPPTSRASALGGGGVALLCAERRWVVLRRAQSVAVWELPPLPAAPAEGEPQAQALAQAPLDSAQQWRKVIELEFKFRTPIVCAAVSPSGELLAVSDLYETKLFRLRARRAGAALEPARVGAFGKAFASVRRAASSSGSSSADTAPGASALTFTPDGQRLVLCSYSTALVYVVEIALPSAAQGTAPQCRIAATLDAHRKRHVPAPNGRQLAGRLAATKLNGSARKGGAAANGTSDGDDSDEGEPASGADEQVYAVIHHAKISPDGQWLLTVDSQRRAHTFSLDLLSHHRSLPSPQHVPSAVVFHPTNPSYVLMLSPTNRATVLNIEKGSASTGSAPSHGDEWIPRLEAAIHRKTRSIREGVIGAVWLPASASSAPAGASPDAHPLLLWGPTWLLSVRATRNAGSSQQNGALANGSKRAHATNGAATEDDTDEDEDEDSEDEDGAGPGGLAGAGAHANRKPREYRAKLTFQYQSNLLIDAMPAKKAGEEHELVIVERPYFSLTGSLPPAYYRGVKYGS